MTNEKQDYRLSSEASKALEIESKLSGMTENEFVEKALWEKVQRERKTRKENGSQLNEARLLLRREYSDQTSQRLWELSHSDEECLHLVKMMLTEEEFRSMSLLWREISEEERKEARNYFMQIKEGLAQKSKKNKMR